MATWCFVHAADLHLDTPFEGIGRVDERVAARLRDASLAAFDALIDETLRRRASFLVLAGDVYDGPRRGLRAQLRVEAGLRRLADHGIATFVAHGNHDPVATGWQLVTAWPDLVHVFGPDQVERHVVRGPDGIRAVVHGISYAERAETRNLARRFRRTDVEALHVGVLHANVGGDADHAPYAPCSLDDLRRGGMDYWALGHVHRRRILLAGTGADPWAVYPGNLQGRSVRASEQGAKGASVVHVRGDVVAEVEHVVLDRVRFATTAAAVDQDSTVGDVVRWLAAGIREQATAAGDRLLVVRTVIEGEGPLHLELAASGTAGLLSALRDRLRDVDVLVTGIEDRSRPPTSGRDARIASLLAEVDVEAAAGEALAAAAEAGWGCSLPDVRAVAAAAHATAGTLLAGDR